MQFRLEDLSPRACDIEVEVDGVTKKYTLSKFNLLAQIWVRKEWGSEEKFNDALNTESDLNKSTSNGAYLEALCKTLHHLLEDKSDFPTWEVFALKCGAGPTEMVNLGRALATVMGMSQAIVDKAAAHAKKKMTEKIQSLGRKSAGKK